MKALIYLNVKIINGCSFLKNSPFIIKSNLLVYIIVFSLVQNLSVYSQCYNCLQQNPLNTISITPNTGFQTISTSMKGGDYAYCNVVQGYTYVWKTCNTPYYYDSRLTLFSGTACSSASKLAYNDDYSGCGQKSKIIWTSTFTGTVKILLSEYINSYNSCSSSSNTFTLEWEASSQNCFHPTYLCSGTNTGQGLIYQNNLAPVSSPNYGSSISTNVINNQTWFYFQIAQAGQIKIDINSLYFNDIDGVIWGPIADINNSCNITSSNPPAYNFDIYDSYQLIINPIVSDIGKYYLLMISSANSNASSAATISFTNTTIGKIVLCPPVLSYNQPVCENNNLQLTASPTVTGGSYHWTGPDGFTSSLQNPVINNASSINSGTYSCYFTTSYGISSTAVVNIQISPKPLTSDIYHN